MQDKQIYQYGAILIFSLLSCGKILGPKFDPDRTHIRIHNASAYDFETVQINPYDELTAFGTIKKGETTGYKAFEIAYRYAYVRLLIDGEEFIIQPIDFVGETPLGPGKFTSVLDVVDFENRILDIATAVTLPGKN